MVVTLIIFVSAALSQCSSPQLSTLNTLDAWERGRADFVESPSAVARRDTQNGGDHRVSAFWSVLVLSFLFLVPLLFLMFMLSCSLVIFEVLFTWLLRVGEATLLDRAPVQVDGSSSSSDAMKAQLAQKRNNRVSNAKTAWSQPSSRKRFW